MGDIFLYGPRKLYEAQLALSAFGLIIEFLVVFAATFALGIYRCTDRSPVSWKRTDYFYFAMTTLAAAMGIADFAISGWSKDLAQLNLKRTEQLVELRSAVVWTNNSCESERREKERKEQLAQVDEYNRQHGIVVPPSEPGRPQWRMLFDFSQDTSLYPEVCQRSAELIALFNETAIINAIKTMQPIPTKLETGTLYTIKHDRLSAAPVEKIIEFDLAQEALTLDTKRRQSPMDAPIAAIQAMDPIISDLNREIQSLHFSSMFRRLYPILFGLGLGIRLARTHYDVLSELSKKR